MRGFSGCDFGPFGRHCQGMGPFGDCGPFNRIGYGPHRSFGPPGHHFDPPGHHFGPHFGPPGHHFGHHSPCHGGRHHGPNFGHRGPIGSGPDFGAEYEHYWPGSCGSGGRGLARGPCSREDGDQCRGCSDGERQGPVGRRGHHGCGKRRDRSSRREGQETDRDQDDQGCEQTGHGERRRRRCHRSPSRRDCRPCGRRDNSDGCGPFGPGFGPSGPGCGPSFGPGFGPHRRPFGPWNRRGPYDRCHNHSDEESGNETERRGRKRGLCPRKNKDQNRDETVLVQRIVVEKVPRCSSV